MRLSNFIESTTHRTMTNTLGERPRLFIADVARGAPMSFATSGFSINSLISTTHKRSQHHWNINSGDFLESRSPYAVGLRKGMSRAIRVTDTHRERFTAQSVPLHRNNLTNDTCLRASSIQRVSPPLLQACVQPECQSNAKQHRRILFSDPLH